MAFDAIQSVVRAVATTSSCAGNYVTPENRKLAIRHLYDAMGALYRARYCASGPEGPIGGKHYPEMDEDTFSRIVGLQTDLQRLIIDLEKQ